MKQAALPRRARETGLDGHDDASGAVHEQAGDVVPAEVAGRELQTVLPQPFADLRDRRARQQQFALVVAERILNVAHAQAPGKHLDRQVLQRLLDDQAGGQAHQLGAGVRCRQAAFNQFQKGLACAQGQGDEKTPLNKKKSPYPEFGLTCSRPIAVASCFRIGALKGTGSV